MIPLSVNVVPDFPAARSNVFHCPGLLEESPILILDEATSALDNESERWIQHSLEELSRNRTTITIAHRLSLLKMPDEIIVLTENGIAERGTHETLLDKMAFMQPITT